MGWQAARAVLPTVALPAQDDHVPERRAAMVTTTDQADGDLGLRLTGKLDGQTTTAPREACTRIARQSDPIRRGLPKLSLLACRLGLPPSAFLGVRTPKDKPTGTATAETAESFPRLLRFAKRWWAGDGVAGIAASDGAYTNDSPRRNDI